MAMRNMTDRIPIKERLEMRKEKMENDVSPPRRCVVVGRPSVVRRSSVGRLSGKRFGRPSACLSQLRRDAQYLSSYLSADVGKSHYGTLETRFRVAWIVGFGKQFAIDHLRTATNPVVNSFSKLIYPYTSDSLASDSLASGSMASNSLASGSVMALTLDLPFSRFFFGLTISMVINSIHFSLSFSSAMNHYLEKWRISVSPESEGNRRLWKNNKIITW